MSEQDMRDGQTYQACNRRDVDVATFGSKLYQWASTLTFTGRNMPFALPFRTNPLDNGFEVFTELPWSVVHIQNIHFISV